MKNQILTNRKMLSVKFIYTFTIIVSLLMPYCIRAQQQYDSIYSVFSVDPRTYNGCGQSIGRQIVKLGTTPAYTAFDNMYFNFADNQGFVAKSLTDVVNTGYVVTEVEGPINPTANTFNLYFAAANYNINPAPYQTPNNNYIFANNFPVDGGYTVQSSYVTSKYTATTTTNPNTQNSSSTGYYRSIYNNGYTPFGGAIAPPDANYNSKGWILSAENTDPVSFSTYAVRLTSFDINRNGVMSNYSIPAVVNMAFDDGNIMPPGSSSSVDGDIAFDADGNVYYGGVTYNTTTQTYKSAIYKTTYTDFVNAFNNTNTNGANTIHWQLFCEFEDPFNQYAPVGIAFSSNRKLYIANYSGGIYTIDPKKIVNKLYTSSLTSIDFATGIDPYNNPNFIARTANFRDISTSYYPTNLLSLPVTFGAVSATITNDSLSVNWSTEKEANNSHFIIEASKDGKDFKQIGSVNSKALQGNSSTSLSYSFTKSLSSIATMGFNVSNPYLIVLASVIILLLMVVIDGSVTARKSVNRRFSATHYSLFGALVVVFIFTFSSCTKQLSSDLEATNINQKVFVRITQVDIDGKTESSKIIQAVVQ